MKEKTSIIVFMSLDFTECDRARMTRDSTYDGRFYTGVHTTGVYCRLVCPVHPARSVNVSFFPSAAAAEVAVPKVPARDCSVLWRLDW